MRACRTPSTISTQSKLQRPGSSRPCLPSSRSFQRGREISQIWRWLVLARRHQKTVRAQEVIFLADTDVAVGFGADIFVPDRTLFTLVIPRYRPGAGQRMVDRRDFGVKEVAVGLVEVDPFLDDSLVVLLQWQAITIECAGAPWGAGLKFKKRGRAGPTFV